jgi:hypothetical protein
MLIIKIYKIENQNLFIIFIINFNYQNKIFIYDIFLTIKIYF